MFFLLKFVFSIFLTFIAFLTVAQLHTLQLFAPPYVVYTVIFSLAPPPPINTDTYMEAYTHAQTRTPLEVFLFLLNSIFHSAVHAACLPDP